MNSSKPKLIITGLSKSFANSGLKVLNNISLTVNEGELVSIIGPSGCGKSTLLDCLAGLSPYQSGKITIQGGAAYMFQDDVMLPWRSVLDNIMLPLELAGVKKETAMLEATNLIKTFGLEGFTSFYPYILSGGMRERASLLRTYLCKKDVMLLDEPFSKLDALTRLRMQEWFLQILYKNKKAVLFVTHDVDEAIYLSDRIYVFSQRPAGIIAELPVTLKKRKQLSASTTVHYTLLKKKILKLLKDH